MLVHTNHFLSFFFVIKNNKKRVGGQTPTPLSRRCRVQLCSAEMKCGICLLAAAGEVECGAVISGVGRKTLNRRLLLADAEPSLRWRPCDGMSCKGILSHQFFVCVCVFFQPCLCIVLHFMKYDTFCKQNIKKSCLPSKSKLASQTVSLSLFNYYNCRLIHKLKACVQCIL